MSDLSKQIQTVAANVQDYRADALETDRRSQGNERRSRANADRVFKLREKFMTTESRASVLRDGFESRIDALEGRVTTLTQENADLKAHLSRIEGRHEGRREAEATGPHLIQRTPPSLPKAEEKSEDKTSVKDVLTLGGKIVAVFLALVTILGLLVRALLENH